MSQWIALRFVPPVDEYEFPIARWTVPSIFSSKPTFFVNRWMPGLQPIPTSPSLRAPASVSSVCSRKSSPALAEASTIRPRSNDEPDARDLVPVVDRRELAEGDLALDRVLDGRVEHLAARAC